jgi:oligoribonuclease
MNALPLLMVDVETSGLDPRTAVLLEVGFAVVTPDRDIVERASWVVPYTPGSIANARRRADPIVQAMHDTSGLWKACASDRAGSGVGYLSALDAAHDDGWRYQWPAHREVIDWVTTHAGDPQIPLCGSSVHFDKHWLEMWFPEITTGRTHRLPDPSGMRELLQRWGPRGREIVESRPAARKLHRVDPDIDDTLAELRHYRDALGLTPDQDTLAVLRVAADVARAMLDYPTATGRPPTTHLGGPS